MLITGCQNTAPEHNRNATSCASFKVFLNLMNQQTANTSDYEVNCKCSETATKSVLDLFVAPSNADYETFYEINQPKPETNHRALSSFDIECRDLHSYVMYTSSSCDA